MGTNLLYCRSEESQQLSVQSVRTTGEIAALRDSNSLPVGPQLYELFIKHFDEETASKLVSSLLDDERLGIWFYDVVDIVGINEKQRKVCHEEAIYSESLANFCKKYYLFHIGSSVEGTFASGETHDGDAIRCDEGYPVVEKIADIASAGPSFLIIRDSTNPAGYFKLQLVLHNEPSYIWGMSADENFIKLKQYCKIDKCGRIVLHEIINMSYNPQYTSITENKPALKVKNFHGASLDDNIAYRCMKWPTFAQEWITRKRFFGWPTKSMIQQLPSRGFFVVKKGHPLSSETNLEWRPSFSLQERKLMFNLTDVQHKCYTVLKMFNREIIKSKCITSYHWKTCLFYVIEQNSGTIWKIVTLFVCIQICILQMLTWVKSECCPNYFIPQDNLFVGTVFESQKFILKGKLEELLKDGFNCLLNVKAGNICDYYRTRESKEDFQRLQSDSEDHLKKSLYTRSFTKIVLPLHTFNHTILEQCYYANKNVLCFIQKLWGILNRITDTDTITEHTTKETKNALSSLLPYIYTCLASNIAVIAIQNTNRKVRDFLFFGSFTYFMKGNISGRLKFISVLYAIGLYEDCQWYINHLDKEYILNAPSFCGCRFINHPDLADIEKIITQLKITTCVSFLPSELPITPDALKYEMFRYFGIDVTQDERADTAFQWNYRAVVDCNIYFVFLKFLVSNKLRRSERFTYFHELNYISRQKVTHRDVALNLIAWIYMSISDTPKSLHLLTLSWNFINSLDLIRCALTEEMKRKQLQCNAAKLHALVVLYKTWFVRNSSSDMFCFHCYSVDTHNLKKCSRCKISTYCSKQCQQNDWNIHKVVCKIVKTYHNI